VANQATIADPQALGKKAFPTRQVPELEQEEERSRGVEAARQKMAAWGEDWAEDEELPQDYGDEMAAGGGSGGGGGGSMSAALQPLSKERQRESVLAQSRIQKVLKARSKAGKYDR